MAINALFEKWRNRDAKSLTKEEWKEFFHDRATSRNRYEQAWKAYLERTKQKTSRVRELLDRTNKIMSTKNRENKTAKKSVLRQKLKDAKEKGRNREDDLLR